MYVPPVHLPTFYQVYSPPIIVVVTQPPLQLLPLPPQPVSTSVQHVHSNQCMGPDIGRLSEECYWCQRYSDIPDCDDCECRFKKCMVTGILCFSDYKTEPVNTCTCGSDIKWFDGVVQSCNKHPHVPLQPVPITVPNTVTVPAPVFVPVSPEITSSKSLFESLSKYVPIVSPRNKQITPSIPVSLQTNADNVGVPVTVQIPVPCSPGRAKIMIQAAGTRSPSPGLPRTLSRDSHALRFVQRQNFDASSHEICRSNLGSGVKVSDSVNQ